MACFANAVGSRAQKGARKSNTETEVMLLRVFRLQHHQRRGNDLSHILFVVEDLRVCVGGGGGIQNIKS